MRGTAKLLLACACIAALLSPACSQLNILLTGHVEATIGKHTIVVTDCYRTSVPLR